MFVFFCSKQDIIVCCCFCFAADQKTKINKTNKHVRFLWFVSPALPSQCGPISKWQDWHEMRRQPWGDKTCIQPWTQSRAPCPFERKWQEWHEMTRQALGDKTCTQPRTQCRAPCCYWDKGGRRPPFKMTWRAWDEKTSIRWQDLHPTSNTMQGPLLLLKERWPQATFQNDKTCMCKGLFL